MIEEGKYSPLTGTIGFIMAPTSVVAQKFYDWQTRVFRKTIVSLRLKEKKYTCFHDIMALLQPLASSATKWVFVPVGTNITAMFSNCSFGQDPSPLSVISVNHCGVKGIRLTAVSNAHRGEKYDARIIEIYSPNSGSILDIERSIYCANDGGKWKFGTSGKPYPFEDEAQYKEKQIQKRFSLNDVWRFMRHFEIDANNESFYIGAKNSKLYEVSMEGGLLPNVKEYELDEL